MNSPRVVPRRVGCLGGGQLGRMLGMAALRLGIEMRFYDPDPCAPAAAVGEHVAASWHDDQALDHFVNGLDVVTCEFESVPIQAVHRVAAGPRPFYPHPDALERCQDRWVEKQMLAAAGFSVAPHRTAGTPAEVAVAVAELGAPAFLKTRRFGYDGKGQTTVSGADDAAAAWGRISGAHSRLLVEAAIPFDRELSLLAVRSQDGETRFYPAVENYHQDGILRRCRAPAAVDSAAWSQVQACLQGLLADLKYVGVAAVELFEVDGQLVANEMAPRVHNSGHWTIEGATTSQFENHLRAICGFPLGETGARGWVGMRNLIGHMPPVEQLLAIPGVSVHLYGKEPRAGRKLGHVTVAANDPTSRDAALDALAAPISSWPAGGGPRYL